MLEILVGNFECICCAVELNTACSICDRSSCLRMKVRNLHTFCLDQLLVQLKLLMMKGRCRER